MQIFKRAKRINKFLFSERQNMKGNNEDFPEGKETSIRGKMKMIYQGIKCHGCNKNTGFPHGDLNVIFTKDEIICKCCGQNIFENNMETA